MSAPSAVLSAAAGPQAANERETLLERLSQTAPGPELTIIVPTRNERDNIIPLYSRLGAALDKRNWEMLVVDDDSKDGTRDVVRWLAQHDRRVRLLSRIGRRGLASAYVEGVQASTADYIAIIDADLQHDETLLPQMLQMLESEPIDIVVGSRYVEHGGIGAWDAGRARISALATRLGRKMLRVPVADPMSGFFMIRREAFDASAHRLSAIGFKILIDLFASAPEPLRARELPFEFRDRHAGESKFDAVIGIEYLMLLADKLVGHIVPVRFLMFAAVGGAGLLVHFAVLWMGLAIAALPFVVAQTLATGVAMVGNFTLNNMLTYRDRRLHGWKFVLGLMSFCLVCSVGGVANVGIAALLFANNTMWWLAGLAGAAMGAVWNYALTSVFTWRQI
ncbi:MAG: glycosyltransferase family 2 protein [Pseudolabrys sp.]